jgi:hypothetical protein
VKLGIKWKLSASRPCRFTHGDKGPGTHLMVGWAGPRTGVDALEEKKSLANAGNAIPVLHALA